MPATVETQVVALGVGVRAIGSRPRALTPPEAVELHADKRCQALDLVDLTDVMPATGLRIGEATAVTSPARAVAMLRARAVDATGEGSDPVFPAVAGGLRDPSTTQAGLRDIFARAGYGRVTSHVYRKTIATLMDNAGLSARQAADELGHSKISMTQDFYIGRKVASTGARDVLEVFGSPAPESISGGRSWP